MGIAKRMRGKLVSFRGHIMAQARSTSRLLSFLEMLTFLFVWFRSRHQGIFWCFSPKPPSISAISWKPKYVFSLNVLDAFTRLPTSTDSWKSETKTYQPMHFALPKYQMFAWTVSRDPLLYLLDRCWHFPLRGTDS